MAKGNKSKRLATDSEAGEGVAQKRAETPVCSFCRTRLDLLKVDERKCWLCGRTDFVSPAEEERLRHQKLAEEQELCCPAPDCPRPVVLVKNSEKFCGECGAPLEKASAALWFRKCVEPEVRKEPTRLSTGRAAFIKAAWRMRLTKEEAEARLDEYAASEATGRQGVVVQTEMPDTASPVEVGARPSARTAHDSTEDARSPYLPALLRRESQRRRMALRVKYGIVAAACVSAVVMLVLFFGRGASVNKADTPQPVPSPSPSLTTDGPPPASPAPTPTPPPMSLVGGGVFQMGRDARDGGDEFESPAHPVPVRPFYIDVYEVTREEYQRCVAAGRCARPQGWQGDTYPADTGRLPVTGVTWEDANQYAAWAGKRLPTEEEWEFAARGGDGRLYPWGLDWKPGQANLGGAGLRAVGAYPGASPFGLYDMLGNAQEWTQSELKRYPDKRAYFPTGFAPASLRVIRGGSYKDPARRVTAAYRNALRTREERSYEQTGFRCARDAERP